jgi:hypothetical protein
MIPPCMHQIMLCLYASNHGVYIYLMESYENSMSIINNHMKRIYRKVLGTKIPRVTWNREVRDGSFCDPRSDFHDPLPRGLASSLVLSD